MRLAAPAHPKTKELKLRLACSFPAAIGHLELLWHFAAQHAPRGDIGKWSDAAIADACGWERDPSLIIEALVATRWLDASAEHRLVVHDWAQHAPAWVSAKLKRNQETFIINTETRSETGVQTGVQTGSEGPLSSSPSPSLPSVTSKRGQQSRACALPPDFGLTGERQAYAEKQGVGSPKTEMEAFIAHHTAHGKVMKNWDAAWRTWCLNAKKFGPRNGLASAALIKSSTHEDALAKQRRDALWMAEYEQRRLKLPTQQSNETDETFIQRINRGVA